MESTINFYDDIAAIVASENVDLRNSSNQITNTNNIMSPINNEILPSGNQVYVFICRNKEEEPLDLHQPNIIPFLIPVKIKLRSSVPLRDTEIHVEASLESNSKTKETFRVSPLKEGEGGQIIMDGTEVTFKIRLDNELNSSSRNTWKAVIKLLHFEIPVFFQGMSKTGETKARKRKKSS